MLPSLSSVGSERRACFSLTRARLAMMPTYTSSSVLEYDAVRHQTAMRTRRSAAVSFASPARSNERRIASPETR